MLSLIFVDAKIAIFCVQSILASIPLWLATDSMLFSRLQKVKIVTLSGLCSWHLMFDFIFFK